MKATLRTVEFNQLQASLWREINYANAISQCADPITDPLCKIPSWASIGFFVECLNKREAEFVPAFRFVISAYHEGLSLTDPCYPVLKRIMAIIENYQGN